MPKMTLKCTGFRALRRNTLFGFAQITISELDLIIKDITLHQKNSSRWAGLPSKPQIKDGVVVKDDAGKPMYVNIFDFGSRAVRDAFSDAVIRAVLEHTPDAFSESQPAAIQRPQVDDSAIPF